MHPENAKVADGFCLVGKTKLVKDGVAFIVGGIFRLGKNNPKVYGHIVDASQGFILDPDCCSLRLDQRDKYIGILESGTSKRDIRVSLPFLDSPLEFAALVGGREVLSRT